MIYNINVFNFLKNLNKVNNNSTIYLNDILNHNEYNFNENKQKLEILFKSKGYFVWNEIHYLQNIYLIIIDEYIKKTYSMIDVYNTKNKYDLLKVKKFIENNIMKYYVVINDEKNQTISSTEIKFKCGERMLINVYSTDIIPKNYYMLHSKISFYIYNNNNYKYNFIKDYYFPNHYHVYKKTIYIEWIT